jgi:hypothetical protein
MHARAHAKCMQALESRGMQSYDASMMITIWIRIRMSVVTGPFHEHAISDHEHDVYE